MIVVDTNLIAYLRIPGTHTALAERVLRRDPDWSAPILWLSEFRNVLVGYVRRRQMDVRTAIEIVEAAGAHLGGREFAVPSEEVVRRAASSGCSAYDCEFVVLAERLGVPLITNDRAVLVAFAAVARTPAAFVA